MRGMNRTGMLGGLAILAGALAGCVCKDFEGKKHCEGHIEGPFVIKDDTPGPGLVYGTADFGPGGAVLIKIQVEDLAAVSGNEATITAWYGDGSPPTSAASPPAGGTEFFSSGSDVILRHWTTHILREFEPAEDRFWVYVLVDHDTGSGRDPWHLVWEWTPSTTPSPDEPHDFNGL